ncbi:DUF602-domain-containing protein [Laetiporus sulphureus 93-53]|uniref:DUF602-domain-containing protein n=1 Tax=Laetiporus sulphureus 93-53 TaxID=1314785 RepID=A0A165FJ58_9APHY|nr:DUF602-domain-containing protein [Laetiporus sulphureus 93-53]KZT09049.1 DUF602-domain-containing protein [Laetiporus sulphureus 93-53]
MGNDGGSIPDRRDLVRSKPKAEQADKANQTRARWFFCALSKRPLQEPIVSCSLGKLYNKDSLLEFLLDRGAYGDGEEICGHIRSLKDVTTLRLTHNHTNSTTSDESLDRATFMCPLNFKEMNGSQPFVYMSTCGCVFSLAGLKAVSGSASPAERESKLELDEKRKEKEREAESKQLDVCPQCATKYDRTVDIITLNPSPEEGAKMREAMERRRAAEPPKTKRKKRKAVTEPADVAKPEAKKRHVSPIPSMNPSIAATSKAVAASLAEEEAKRKAHMSEAVKSLYKSKDNGKRETFMTMGTFTRVRISFLTLEREC